MEKLAITPDRGEINREYSQKEIDQIAAGLINNSIDINNVPSNIHSQLLTPLSLARTEAKLGNQVEKYNYLNNVIWSLKLSLAPPDKSLMTQMGSTSKGLSKHITFKQKSSENPFDVSLITAVIKEDDNDNAVTLRRLKGNLDTTQKFYDDEEKRIQDLKEKEYQEICNSFKMKEVPADANEARRARDEFELQKAASKNKWDEKLKQLKIDKEKEISELQDEFELYDKPPKKFNADQVDVKPFSKTVQVSSNKQQKTQKSPPKRMTQTLQPKKSPKLSDKSNQSNEY